MTNTFTLIEFWVMNHKSAKLNHLNALAGMHREMDIPTQNRVKQLIILMSKSFKQ